MKYFTLIFFVFGLIFRIMYYGLIIDFPFSRVIEIVLIVIYLALIIYWLITLWKLEKVEKRVKTQFTFGVLFIPDIFATLLAFKINDDGSLKSFCNRAHEVKDFENLK